MAGDDLSDELKAVGDAVTRLARKAEALYGQEVKSFLDAVKIKLREVEELVDDEVAKRKSE